LKVFGFLGSPRTNGTSAKLLASALKGAAHQGAETKRYDLIKYTIRYCRGCFKCVYENHELPIGICSIKDDMASILGEYHQADGYILACPVYDRAVTALMKTFLERKIALFYKQREDFGRIPDARVKADFKKKAALIATGGAVDEYREIMADPCFELMEAHFILEQVEVIDRLYVGGVDNLSKERLSEKREDAFTIGVRLVNEIEKARQL